jgi:hypothetical protein
VVNRRADHRFLVAGPALLDQSGPDNLGHCCLLPCPRALLSTGRP